MSSIVVVSVTRLPPNRARRPSSNGVLRARSDVFRPRLSSPTNTKWVDSCPILTHFSFLSFLVKSDHLVGSRSRSRLRIVARPHNEWTRRDPRYRVGVGLAGWWPTGPTDNYPKRFATKMSILSGLDLGPRCAAPPGYTMGGLRRTQPGWGRIWPG